MSLNVTCDGPVVVLELNRGEKANAVNREMLSGIRDTIERCNVGQAVLLCGAGRHFCGGADLKEAGADPEESKQALLDALYTLASCKIPVVAAVHGTASGAGWMIAALADVTLVASDAKFVMPEVGLGIESSLAHTVLENSVPSLPLKRTLLAGESLLADDFVRLGAAKLVAGDQQALRDEALEYSRSLANKPPAAYGHMKAAINGGLTKSLKPHGRTGERASSGSDG